MARQLKNGNYLVPHLLAFALKEYHPTVSLFVQFEQTWKPSEDARERTGHFTAIRLDNGNTLVSQTHGNKVVEFDRMVPSLGKLPTMMLAVSSKIRAAHNDLQTAIPLSVAMVRRQVFR